MWFRRERIIRKYVHTRLFVTLLSGGTFSGLLLDADGKAYEFADVRLVSNTNSQPVDGRLVVERSRVAYMQRTTDAI